MSEAPQAPDAPLSVEQAVGLLSVEPEAATPEAAPEVTEPQSEAEPPAEDDPAAEEPSGDEPEEPEEPAEVIPPPQSWSAEDRAVWDALPAEAQAVVMARETERDRSTQQAVQKAAESSKQAQTAVESVTNIKAALDQILPTAIETFKSKWNDWTPQAQVELARRDPDSYIARKAEFESEQAQMAQLSAVNQAAQTLAFENFVQAEGEKLKTLAPDLADPKAGQTRKQALVTFLVTTGVPQDVIPTLDANTVSLAYDAMRWRQAQGKLAKPTPSAPARTVKPTAAASVRSPQRDADAAKNRFAQTGSVDDAVAYMNARR